MSKEEFEEWCKPWKNALMVKVLGKCVTFAFMEQRLRKDWESKGSTEVRKIATWIRIPNLPIELYNHRFLWRVGSAIGHMLKVDRTTSIHSRGKFARICVEIDLAKQLVPRISVLGCELHLEYESLHQICFSCGKYGHRSEQCIENLASGDNPMEDTSAGDTTPVEVPVGREGDQNGKSETPRNQQNHINGQSIADFGPWMMVKRYVDKKKAQSGHKKSQANQVPISSYNSKKDGSPKGKDSGQGSRFANLHGKVRGTCRI
ncbi:uncharacterized protein LOC107645204 [Arachis ipaensis]|uniref:CCHC-type domain-containing protein n=1 Tax=Arachis hypogaea TaxID=3818 RepID=A0A445AN66_ARAHY|nr:uncharacterized protein LOC107645204 [Arachis ipaensis]XP_025627768.1 uncharacterized protein LOC112720893 [Arachis hypogaea]RYR27887.1 hypothetical protein Ahy_B01g051957 [Arachis hypogaea]